MKMSELITTTKPQEEIILERIQDIQKEVQHCKILMDKMFKTLNDHFDKIQKIDESQEENI